MKYPLGRAMECRVANRRVRCLSRAVIGEGEAEGGGPRADRWGARGAEVGTLGAFLFTSLTQEPGTHAAGPYVFGLVANGTGGGPAGAAGAADATVAVCAGRGGAAPEGPAAEAEVGAPAEGPLQDRFRRLIHRSFLAGELLAGGRG